MFFNLYFSLWSKRVETSMRGVSVTRVVERDLDAEWGIKCCRFDLGARSRSNVSLLMVDDMIDKQRITHQRYEAVRGGRIYWRSLSVRDWNMPPGQHHG